MIDKFKEELIRSIKSRGVPINHLSEEIIDLLVEAYKIGLDDGLSGTVHEVLSYN